MDEGRLKHSYTVATKMVEIGRKKNLSDMYYIAYIQFIRYENIYLK